MPCTPGGTLSPGYIYLNYVHTTQAIDHRTRVRLHYGVDPADTTTMQTLADGWANQIQPCLSTFFTLTDWGTLDENQTPVVSGTLTAALVGSHSVGTGAEDYRSRTVTFTGRGQSLTPGQCTGEARMVLFVGNTYNFTPGQRNIASGVDVALDGLRTFLDNHPLLWSDYYGHFAGVRGKYPVQLNAAVQRRHGS